MKRRALQFEQIRNQGFCMKPFHSGEYRKDEGNSDMRCRDHSFNLWLRSTTINFLRSMKGIKSLICDVIAALSFGKRWAKMCQMTKARTGRAEIIGFAVKYADLMCLHRHAHRSPLLSPKGSYVIVSAGVLLFTINVWVLKHPIVFKNKSLGGPSVYSPYLKRHRYH